MGKTLDFNHRVGRGVTGPSAGGMRDAVDLEDAARAMNMIAARTRRLRGELAAAIKPPKPITLADHASLKRLLEGE